MAAHIDHYCYNALPSLSDADTYRQMLSTEELITGPIRDVFIKHDAHRDFCLYLQHRHHQVNEGEAIVKVKGTAYLANDDQMKDFLSLGNKIVPMTWMTTAQEVVPMELAAVPDDMSVSTPTPAFLSDFLEVLAANGCAGVFGIDTLAETDWSELTIGDASVVVPCKTNNEHEANDMLIPVAFEFNDKRPAFKVHGRCKINHRHTSTPGGR